jgi:F0F1-type ATP synthase assembly protein I
VTTIALEMVIPGAIGLWIDQRLGTVMVFLMLGLVLGVTTGIMHLVRLTGSTDRDGPPDGKSSDKRLK